MGILLVKVGIPPALIPTWRGGIMVNGFQLTKQIANIGLPFNLDGWVSSGNGKEYDGYLERDGESIEAWEGFYPENTIHR